VVALQFNYTEASNAFVFRKRCVFLQELHVVHVHFTFQYTCIRHVHLGAPWIST
jgi:hypothetical protein